MLMAATAGVRVQTRVAPLRPESELLPPFTDPMRRIGAAAASRRCPSWVECGAVVGEMRASNDAWRWSKAAPGRS